MPMQGNVQLFWDTIHISDLVDTVDYQLKQMAATADLIAAYHHSHHPAIVSFHAQLRRLRDLLEAHIAPRTPAAA